MTKLTVAFMRLLDQREKKTWLKCSTSQCY